jgi:hypothetical protein
MKMAVYLVTQADAPKGALPNMVEARTAQQAIGHVARSKFAGKPLSTKEAVAWSKQGVEIETAGVDAPEAEAGLAEAAE